jgi:hypothetical protein
MSDGGSWNEPAAPERASSGLGTPEPTAPAPPAPIPVTAYGDVPAAVPNPVPLPLPPGAVGTVRNGRRTAAIVSATILAVLLACGLMVAGATWVLGTEVARIDAPGVPLPPFSAGLSTAQWADGGRYAVAEFAPRSTGGAPSVIVWDSRSGATTKVDGFRLVTTEPWSSEVWLARPAPALDGSATGSPWKQASDGASWDGPGVAWRWDAASPGRAPVRVEQPSWQWKGRAGVSAEMSVDPSRGLRPDRLAFRTSAGRVDAQIPAGIVTFLPVGWSPSGRYFAVADTNQWGGPGGGLAVFDSTTGSLVASHVLPRGDLQATYKELAGAAWDPAKDVLLVVGSTTYENEDQGVDSWASGLDARSGAMSPLPHPPAVWIGAGRPAELLGTDPSGALVCVATADGRALFRISASGVRAVKALANEDYWMLSQDSYSESGRLLVWSLEDTPDDLLVAVGLNGKNPRRIWPQQ